MRILISNDDGYFAPGIEMLATVAREFGEITVVAPERDRSGASNSLTLDRPLTVRTAGNGFLYVNGTPTDCVHLAVTGLLDEPPDLVLSGINDGANMGDDTLYSGTVAAAMEGYLLGFPAIAFSLAKKGFADLGVAADIVRELIARWVRAPLDGPMLLNVNIPACPRDAIGGMRVTHLGRRHHAKPVVRDRSPRGQDIWWIGPTGAARDAGPGTDFNAIEQSFVSITPLDIDLTGKAQLSTLEGWIAQP